VSKTNHRRGNKSPRFCLGQKTCGRYVTWAGYGETVISGLRVNASAIVSSEAAKGVRRDKAGAKKFVRSRTRFHENAALQKLVKSLEIN